MIMIGIYNYLSETPRWGTMIALMIIGQVIFMFEIGYYQFNYQAVFGVPQNIIESS
jgi:fructose-1,6-bisphosphatase/inositol monophosphatase family enzyme